MGHEISIIRPDREPLVLVVDDSSYRRREIMGEDELVLNFSLAVYEEIPAGSTVTFEGDTYTLFQSCRVNKRGSRNFEYQATFSADYAYLRKYMFYNWVDKRLSFDLTARPWEHLQMIVDNLNDRLQSGDTPWSLGEGCIESAEKLISYSCNNCMEALQAVADTFETEWEVKGRTIFLRKVEYNADSPLKLSYGRGNGLRAGIQRTAYNDETPAARVYIQGGERNIFLSEYGSRELKFPKSAGIGYDGEKYEGEDGYDNAKAVRYVTDDLGQSVAREDGPVNGSDVALDLTHIYPSHTCEVESVKYLYKSETYGSIDELVAAYPELADENAEGWDNVQVDVIVKEDEYLPDYSASKLQVPGETRQVVFQSGNLASREFDINDYNHKERRFKLVSEWVDGFRMPAGPVYHPTIDDKFIVVGVSLPYEYVSEAEYKALKEAVKYLYEHETQKVTINAEIDPIQAARKWDLWRSKIILGGFVRLTDDDLLAEVSDIRIRAIKQYVNTPNKPVVELNNGTASVSLGTTIRKLENQEVHTEDLFRDSINFSKRRFSDVSQTLDMLKGAFDNFSEGINPVTVETMSMLVGDERLQFVFTESLSSDVEKGFSYSYKSKADVLEGEDESKVQGKNQIVIGSAFIKHMTLGIDSISPVHASNEYKRWALPEKRFLLDPAKGYYIYAYVSDVSSAGEFVVSDSALKDDGSSHYLLIGILNSEYDGQRSFARMYGYTEVRPGQIVTEEIRSSDGKTWLDLVKGILHLNDLAGVSGIKDTQKGDKSIAAWFGGLMEDIELDKNPVNPAKSVLRHDGTGYFADGNIRWDKEGGAEFGGGDFKILPDGSIVFGKDIKISSDGDETLGSILTILATLTDMFEWADKEHSAIKTKYPLFSEKTISSGGKGEDGQGGGSGVVVMDSWDDFDATLPQVLGAILGIELHNRLTALESGNADSPYATIAFVEKTISDLIGGADSAYDTLLEIQQILQGNEDSIGAILEEIAKKASKDELKEVSDKVDDHETRISDLEEKNNMFRFVTDADGTTRIETEYPLSSTKTIASGGKGEKGDGGGGTGTVMAVEVNGEIHDAEDGIVTLPDYPTKAEYERKIAELDAKDSQHTFGISENKQEIETIKPKVEQNKTDIGNLQRVDEDIKSQLADIKKITDKFSYEADGDILKTGSNLVSLKTVGSGGRGEEGSGGDSGSSGTLDGLLDVTIDFGGATKEDEEGQVLAYDAESFEWKNRKTMHRHPQGVASNEWVITHNLNKVPNVKIIEDSTGEQVYGAIKVNDMNKITVSFGGAFSGTAYLD